MKRNYKAKYEMAEFREKELEATVKLYDWIPELEEKINILQTKDKEVKRMQDKIATFQNNMREWEAIQINIDFYNKKLKYKDKIDKLLDTYNSINTAKENINEYKNKLGDLVNFIYLNQKANIKLQQEKQINKLLTQYQKNIFKSQEQSSIIKEKLETLKINLEKIIKIKEKLEKKEEQLHNNIGGVCPLCGMKIMEA